MTNRIASIENDSPTDTVFEKSIRSFEIVLTLLGSWPIRSRSKMIQLAHTLYTASIVIVAIYLFIVGLVYFVVYPKFDNLVPGLVLIEIWYFQAICCHILFYLTKRNKSFLPHFFQQLNEYYINYARKEDDIQCFLHRTRKRLWICLVIIHAIISVLAIYVALKMNKIEDIAVIVGDIYSFPFAKQQFIAYILQSLLHYTTNFTLLELLLFEMVIFIMVACALTHEFRAFNGDLRHSLEDPGQLDSDVLEVLRQRHERLRELVEQADRTFGKYIAANFITFIPFICFVFYQLLYRSLDLQLALSTGNLAAGMVLEVVVISVFSVRLTEKTEEHITLLYSAKTNNLEQKVVLQLLFLTESMKGHYIGFSIWNMLNVSKETILTFLGAILSYIVVVADFQR